MWYTGFIFFVLHLKLYWCKVKQILYRQPFLLCLKYSLSSFCLHVAKDVCLNAMDKKYLCNIVFLIGLLYRLWLKAVVEVVWLHQSIPYHVMPFEYQTTMYFAYQSTNFFLKLFDFGFFIILKYIIFILAFLSSSLPSVSKNTIILYLWHILI